MPFNFDILCPGCNCLLCQKVKCTCTWRDHPFNIKFLSAMIATQSQTKIRLVGCWYISHHWIKTGSETFIFSHIPAWLPSCVPEEWHSGPHTTACREGCRRERCSSSPGSWFWPARCWRHCRPHQWSWSCVCSLHTKTQKLLAKANFPSHVPT